MHIALETIAKDQDWIQEDYSKNGIKVYISYDKWRKDKKLHVSVCEFYKYKTADIYRLISIEDLGETGWKDCNWEKFRTIRYTIEAETMYQGVVRVIITTDQTVNRLNIKNVDIITRKPSEQVIKTYACIKSFK